MSRQKNQSSAKDKLSASEQQLKAAIQQLRASEQQLKAANQQLNASNQQLHANQEELRKVNHDLQERVKDLTCLYGLSHLVERRDVTLEEVFQGLAELIPSAWQYPEITVARVTFDNRRFKTSNFRKTTWMQSADIKVHDRKAGTIEVCYLKKRPVIDGGPFLKEERELLNALAKRLGHITERKQAEEALWESEEKYRTLTESSLTGIFIHQEGKYVFLNNRFAKMHGYKAKELLGKEYLSLIHPDEREIIVQLVSKRLVEKKVKRRYEVRRLKKNGETIWCEMMAVRIEYRGRPAIMGNITDITKRKRAEEKLRATNQQLEASTQQLKAANQQLQASEQQLKAANQQLGANEQQLKAANQQLEATNQQLRASEQQLKSLASELTLAEEHERRRIATELHATIGQSLVISKLQLDALRASVPSRDIAKTLEEVSNSLDQAIGDTRALTFDLSSPILYELGFEAAVAEWLTERIQEKHHIATEFEDDEQPKPLEDDVRVLLFRDVRELLINVVKHANARKIKVSIRKVCSWIHVSVEDDGVGFDVAKVVSTSAKAGGFGLFSVRERLEELGGRLEIDSKPGHGTKVTLMAPLKQQNTKGG
jgi:PAS domain S-box-containing protein